jgi:hypothetical protein
MRHSWSSEVQHGGGARWQGSGKKFEFKIPSRQRMIDPSHRHVNEEGLRERPTP